MRMVTSTMSAYIACVTSAKFCPTAASRQCTDGSTKLTRDIQEASFPLALFTLSRDLLEFNCIEQNRNRISCISRLCVDGCQSMIRFVPGRFGVAIDVLLGKVPISVKGWSRNTTCNGRKYRTEKAGSIVTADLSQLSATAASSSLGAASVTFPITSRRGWHRRFGAGARKRQRRMLVVRNLGLHRQLHTIL